MEFLLTLPESDRVTVADFLHESVHRSKSHNGAVISAEAAIATMLARHPTLFSQADKQKM